MMWLDVSGQVSRLRISERMETAVSTLGTAEKAKERFWPFSRILTVERWLCR